MALLPEIIKSCIHKLSMCAQKLLKIHNKKLKKKARNMFRILFVCTNIHWGFQNKLIISVDFTSLKKNKKEYMNIFNVTIYRYAYYLAD